VTLLHYELVEALFFLLRESEAYVSSRREFSARRSPHALGLPANVP
jgi:hypothetical protein